MKISIRPEMPADYPAITSLLDAAFEQPDEGLMVQRLRKLPEYIPDLSLIAEQDVGPIGCIYFSNVVIRANGKVHSSLSLAPVAVLPEFQRRGIGSRLIREGLKRARAMGFHSVIVLGHPSYYPRFGFKPASQWGIRAPFPAPEEAFMAMELTRGDLDGISGTVIFSKAFGLDQE